MRHTRPRSRREKTVDVDNTIAGVRKLSLATKAAIGLISGSVLILEISLTRFFSILFVHHYTYLVLSIAVFGLAAGGIFVKWRADRRGIDTGGGLPWWLPAVGSISVLVMTGIIIWIPAARTIPVAAVLALVPFVMVGAFLASVFQRFPESSRTIYGFDLLGAAAGALISLLFLRLGAINTHIFIALTMSIAALLFAHTSNVRKKIPYALLAFGIFLVTLLTINSITSFLGRVPFAELASKQLDSLLQNKDLEVKIKESRWSAFGRTDYVTSGASDSPIGFYIDGVSGTPMYEFNGDFMTLRNTNLDRFPVHLPLTLAGRDKIDKALIIGAGGGRDVLVSLMHGARDVTAVEVNKDLVSLMKKYSNINGGIYNDYPGVKVVVAEGRNYIKRTDDSYDVIILTMPVIQSSRSIEGFALTEGYLFTLESMSEYYDRLTPNGQLIIVGHSEFEIFRLVSTSLALLRDRGIPATLAMQRIYTFGQQMMPAFVLKKSPLTKAEADYIFESVHLNNWVSPSMFIPFLDQTVHAVGTGGSTTAVPMINPPLYAISKGQIKPEEIFADGPADLRPVTDDRPFFYQFEKRIPRSVLTVLIAAVSLLLVSFLIGYRRRKKTLRKTGFVFTTVFFVTGTAFMLFEVAIIQKLVLYLGQPVLSLALVLAFLIGGLGVGSISSSIIFREPSWRIVKWSLLLTGLLSLLYGFGAYRIPGAIIGSPYAARVVVTAILMFLYGLVAGVPFPTAMALLKDAGLPREVPRMWSVNAAASVLGSALAVAIGTSLGFSFALAGASALYGVGGLIATVMAPSRMRRA